jgi:hypothetical protein
MRERSRQGPRALGLGFLVGSSWFGIAQTLARPQRHETRSATAGDAPNEPTNDRGSAASWLFGLGRLGR